MAQLRIVVSENHLTVEELRHRLESARFRIKSLKFEHHIGKQCKEFDCEILCPSQIGGATLAKTVTDLEQSPGVLDLEWERIGSGSGV